MFLSGKEIINSIERGDLAISPFSIENVKPASYVFTLSSELKKFQGATSATYEKVTISDEGYFLQPGEFIIGLTQETVDLKNKFLCIMGTKGSVAQSGVDVLQGSIICEPDTNNPLMLEIKNNGNNPVKLFVGMKIAKGIFGKIENDR